MERLIQTILQFIAVFICVGGLLYGAYWYANNRDSLSEQRVETTFETYQASASVHRGRYKEYAGLCTDIGLPDTVNCTANEDSYRMWVKIGEGRFQCIDHTGFNGVVSGLVRSNNLCQTDN